MNILFITHRIPYPPDKGDKIRCYHILKYLAERHRVSLAGLVDDPNDLTSTTNLRRHLANLIYVQIQPWHQRLRMARALLNNTPLTVSYFWSSALKKEIDLLVEKISFDVLFVFSSTMAEYCWNLKIPIKIIDFCDLDSAKFAQYARIQHGPSSWLFRRESRRLAAYEQQAACEFDYTILIGPEEKRLFSCDGYRDRVRLMSNGIDLARYQNIPDAPTAGLVNGHPYVVFVGAMDYLPNIDAANWFASEMFPTLKHQIPELEFWIIGRNPVRKIRHLSDPVQGIRITGYLDDLMPILKNARVFVAPMRIACGMQTKILEAMACQVPVVTTPNAARGIGAAHGRELLVAENADDFIRQTLLLFHDQSLAGNLLKNSHRFLVQKFDWEQNLQLLDQLLSARPGLAKKI